MKPHELNTIVDTEDVSYLIMSQSTPAKSDAVIFNPASSSQQLSDIQSSISGGEGLGSVLMDESVSMDEFKLSPATDALDFLLTAASQASNAPDSVPLSSSEEQMDPSTLLVDLNDLLRRDPTFSSLGANLSHPPNDVINTTNSINTSVSMAIPKRNVTLLQTSSYKNRDFVGASSGLIAPPPSISSSFSNTPMWGDPLIKQELKLEPTGATYSTLTPMPTEETVKMETTDFDDLDALFLSSSSPNVTLGVGQPTKRQTAPTTSHVTVAVPQTVKNTNLWQIDDFPWSSVTTASPSLAVSSASKDLLSSSVPVTFLSAGVSPLSDILTDISTPSTAPSQSPSQAGPQRHSTLHKLLMRKEVIRPVPQARSPDNRKTLERIKTNLSASSTLLGQQGSPLSKSAPTSDTNLIERIWKRREPRAHFTSVCSVGESSVTDEVNDILEEMSPSQLQDIASDDEDDEEKGGEKYTSDDDSDFEGTSPLQSGSGGKSGGSKRERHFWQYNVQAKGPKGQKILIQTKIEDPHVLNEIVDPVFSGDVQMQGIKHSGKARRGDGNDLTANPKKLAAIGKELDMLSKVINDLTPVSEMPFGARCKSRKEKNKLASRACRLKKKAQHEANKLKLHGLQEEHTELLTAIEQARALIVAKVEPNSATESIDVTAEMDKLIKKTIKYRVAGATTEYVNKQIEKNLPYV